MSVHNQNWDQAIDYLRTQTNPGSALGNSGLFPSTRRQLQDIHQIAVHARYCRDTASENLETTGDIARLYDPDTSHADSSSPAEDSGSDDLVQRLTLCATYSIMQHKPEGFPGDLFTRMVETVPQSEVDALAPPPKVKPVETHRAQSSESVPASRRGFRSRMRISPLKVILGVTLGLGVIAAVAGAILFAPPVAAAFGLAGAALLATQISLIAGGGIVALIALGVLVSKSRSQSRGYVRID